MPDRSAPPVSEVITMSEAFSEMPNTADPSGIVTLSEALGIKSSEVPESTFPRVPEDQKDSFIQRLGDDIYDFGLNNALIAAGGFAGGLAEINEFFGFATQLNRFEWFNEGAVESLRDQAQWTWDSVNPEGVVERNYYQFLRGLASLGISIPIDVATGGATKRYMAGRMLPNMARIVSKIPDFALGLGWRQMAQGIEEAEGPIEATIGGVKGAVEGVTMGTLYASLGGGLKLVPKLSAIGGASTVYDAAKDGRLPSWQEFLDGFIQGGAMGLSFAALPHLRAATKIGSERNALRGYEKEITKAVKKKEFSKLVEIQERMVTDPKIRPEIRKALTEPFLDALRQRGEVVPSELQLGLWKDKPVLSQRNTTLIRNLRRIAPKEDVAVLERDYLDPVKANETYRVRWEIQLGQHIKETVKGFDIKVGGKSDKLVMRFGEKRMTLEQLKVEAPKNWSEIVQASKWFRGQYDSLMGIINEVRVKHGIDPIPKLEHYFRHMNELGAASGIFGFTLGGRNPPTAIAGLVSKKRPGKPFTPVELKRKKGAFTESAIKGLENYMEVAGNQIFHTDSVQRFRTLERYIQTQALTNDKIDLSNFMINLRDHTNILAGQPQDIDRSMQRYMGRENFAKMRWLSTRASRNMIAGSISAALSNFIPFTQSWATTGKIPAAKGMFTAAVAIMRKGFFKIEGVESEFLLRRSRQYKVVPGLIGSATQVATAPFLAVDRFVSTAIVAGKYYELRGRRKGVRPTPKEAMKQADDYTAGIVADRSWGQLPTLFEAKGLRIVTQFQVEVANMVSWLQYDVPIEAKGSILKHTRILAEWAVLSLVFNNLYEEMMGRRPTIDPIYMVATLAGETKAGEDRPFKERISPAVKEMVGSLPFGNIVLPGGRVPLSAGIPNPFALVEGKSGFIQEASKPLAYLAAPFGGGQVKKTIEGMIDYSRGYSLTPAGMERYSIHPDFANFMRGFMFGKNAFPESVDYWKMPQSER